MYSSLQLAKKYAVHYWQSLNSKGHGVHSPFVFDFIKFVKNGNEQDERFDRIESIREDLIRNKNLIEVEDYGAGSSVIKTSTRAIHKMAKSSLKSKRFAQLLYRIVRYYQPNTMVELGTSFGTTSAYLASGNPGGKLFTLEGAPSVAVIARKNFEKLGIHTVQLIEGDFKHTFRPLLSGLSQVDLAFVDGNHKKQPTLQYFEELLNKSTPNTILIFDDIHWSREMEEAWEIIKNNETVTLTIDLFFIGIVFLKKDFKVKQHFRVRF